MRTILPITRNLHSNNFETRTRQIRGSWHSSVAWKDKIELQWRWVQAHILAWHQSDSTDNSLFFFPSTYGGLRRQTRMKVVRMKVTNNHKHIGLCTLSLRPCVEHTVLFKSISRSMFVRTPLRQDKSVRGCIDLCTKVNLCYELTNMTKGGGKAS